MSVPIQTITQAEWKSLPIGTIIYDLEDNRMVKVVQTKERDGILSDAMTIMIKDLFRPTIHKGRTFDHPKFITFEEERWHIAIADEIPDPHWRTRDILARCVKALQFPDQISIKDRAELLRTTLVEIEHLARETPLATSKESLL